jgi:DNA-binding CsgD family transcriptional regulator
MHALTTRQAEVLWHVARGRTNRQIARELTISERTVKEHVSAIFRRVGVTNRTQAALAFMQYDDEARTKGRALDPIRNRYMKEDEKMDGYFVSPEPVALSDQVRHVALLETKEYLAAFEGDARSGAMIAADDQPLTYERVRRGSPFGGDVEGFYLVTRQHFTRLSPGIIEAATLLTTGNILVMTAGAAIPNALWGSVAIGWQDTRVPESQAIDLTQTTKEAVS